MFESARAWAGAGRASGLWLLSLWQTEKFADAMKRLWEYLDADYKIGNFRISVISLAFGVIIVTGAFLISRGLRSFFRRRMAHHKRLDEGLQYTFLRLTHYVIVTLGVLWAFSATFNTDLTSLAVVFTALSVGIGFGLQFIAGDIASGFILLFERPLRIGDFITVTGPDSKTTEGRVQSINLRTTVVTTNDHISAVVPNSKLVNQTLINWSYGERRSRISIPVGVAYSSDVALVTRTLLRAAEGVEYVMTDPKPAVQFLNFGDYSLNFRLLVWTARPRRYPQIKSDINYRIWQLFNEVGIEIPFPQQELRVRTEGPPPDETATPPLSPPDRRPTARGDDGGGLTDGD